MKFELTAGDLLTPAVIRLEKHLQEKLVGYRQKNDDPGGTMDDKATARHRGRIAELKEILALLQQPEKT